MEVAEDTEVEEGREADIIHRKLYVENWVQGEANFGGKHRSRVRRTMRDDQLSL